MALVPGAVTWIDVVIGRDDPEWVDDVGLAFAWLGAAWARAVAAIDPASAPAVHDGPLVRGRWGRQVCFAGLGPGEVSIRGRKLVGLSQRRTRAGARFQTVVHHRWDRSPYGALPGVEVDQLPTVGTVAVEPAAIEAALLGALAR